MQIFQLLCLNGQLFYIMIKHGKHQKPWTQPKSEHEQLKEYVFARLLLLLPVYAGPRDMKKNVTCSLFHIEHTTPDESKTLPALVFQAFIYIRPVSVSLSIYPYI